MGLTRRQFGSASRHPRPARGIELAGLAAILLSAAFVLQAGQSREEAGQSPVSADASVSRACPEYANATRTGNQSSDASSGEIGSNTDVTSSTVAALTGCPAAPSGKRDDRDWAPACLASPEFNFQVTRDGELIREVPIWQQADGSAFFFETGMTIDADGAPNAYNPDDTGLDELANAGEPGNWEGLAKDRDGNPYIQGPDDPFPGYFVSATALADRTKAPDDPGRYVNASKIPYIVLPAGMFREFDARPGDFAAVFNLWNGTSSYAIFADIGPPDRIGEGSIALAENLGVRSDARRGGTRGGILFLVFPGSGNGSPRTAEEISAEGSKLFQNWGGMGHLNACATP
jgi:hypothetical protein